MWYTEPGFSNELLEGSWERIKRGGKLGRRANCLNNSVNNRAPEFIQQLLPALGAVYMDGISVSFPVQFFNYSALRTKWKNIQKAISIIFAIQLQSNRWSLLLLFCKLLISNHTIFHVNRFKVAVKGSNHRRSEPGGHMPEAPGFQEAVDRGTLAETWLGFLRSKVLFLTRSY